MRLAAREFAEKESKFITLFIEDDGKKLKYSTGISSTYLLMNPDLQQAKRLRQRRIHLAMLNAGAGAHDLNFAGRNHTVSAYTVAMLHGAAGDVRQNFHVAMGVRAVFTPKDSNLRAIVTQIAALGPRDHI